MSTDAQLRVALVLGTSAGGVGQHVRSVAAGLVDAGHRVVVLGPAATEELFGFTTVGAGFRSAEISAHPDPRDAVVAARVRRQLAGADVVHAHGFRAGLVARLALVAPQAGRRRPPLVVTWHNQVLAGGLAGRLLAVAERVVARGADVTLGCSPDLVARARQLGARDARQTAVPAPPLPPPRQGRDDVRAALGVGSRPLLLAVGRLHPQKGYPTLLTAAALWARRDPVPQVVVAGAGPQGVELADRVAHERLPVTFLGRRDDVGDLLAAADLFVLPSLWEGYPLAAQEALRAGVPLVATAVGGVPDLVGSAAVLVPAGDAQALAEAVAGLLDDPVQRAQLAAAGRQRATTWPDEAAVVAELAALYRTLVEDRA